MLIDLSFEDFKEIHEKHNAECDCDCPDCREYRRLVAEKKEK